MITGGSLGSEPALHEGVARLHGVVGAARRLVNIIKVLRSPGLQPNGVDIVEERLKLKDRP